MKINEIEIVLSNLMGNGLLESSSIQGLEARMTGYRANLSQKEVIQTIIDPPPRKRGRPKKKIQNISP